MKSVTDLKLNGKRVLVRVDYNLPMDEHQAITDDNRIRETLPLLNYLRENQAKIIVASHMGRPKGKPDPAQSLYPASRRLSELIGGEVGFVADCIGPEAQARVDALGRGEILVLENLRFHPGEAKNDVEFARQLAGLCDVFVNDAFAVSHRSAASIVAITELVPECAAGFLLEKELAAFHSSVQNPVRPLVAVIGGAKVSSKLEALENMINRVDTLIIGGAMANTFLKSTGVDTGKSMVEEDLVETAAKILEKARAKGISLLLPKDVVVAQSFSNDAPSRVVSVGSIPPDWMALDIGPDTADLFAAAVKGAGTIVWNGPMGVFEMESFGHGTRVVAEAIAGSGAFSVVGGGDTGLAVKVFNLSQKMSYISTGGGAFLYLMEGKDLPGALALEKS
ncbi:MAG: phosphoglycerate kinase [Pseudomonadota bacterium]